MYQQEFDWQEIQLQPKRLEYSELFFSKYNPVVNYQQEVSEDLLRGFSSEQRSVLYTKLSKNWKIIDYEEDIQIQDKVRDQLNNLKQARAQAIQVITKVISLFAFTDKEIQEVDELVAIALNIIILLNFKKVYSVKAKLQALTELTTKVFFFLICQKRLKDFFIRGRIGIIDISEKIQKNIAFKGRFGLDQILFDFFMLFNLMDSSYASISKLFYDWMVLKGIQGIQTFWTNLFREIKSELQAVQNSEQAMLLLKAVLLQKDKMLPLMNDKQKMNLFGC